MLLDSQRLPRGHSGLPAAPGGELHRLLTTLRERPRLHGDTPRTCDKRRSRVERRKSVDVDRSFRDHRLVSTQFDIEQPVVDAGGWRVLAPFRFREYRLLIAAVSLSIFAEGMWAVVMALQVIELDNDPASLSLVATCLGVGLVAFVLVGGIAADRINQRTIIIAVETVNVIAVSAVAVLGLAWRAADLAYGGGRRGAGHRRGVLLPRLQRDPAADPARRATAGRQRRRRRRAPGVPARRRPRRRRHRGRCDVPCRWARSRWPRCSPSAWCCWWPPGRDENACRASRIRSGRTCCAICATASASWCARRGCCGRCCSPACSCSWCSDRSRCCCRSSPRTDSTTAPGRTASSWRSSASAARWARWRCRRDGCPVAT